jgi:O-antigen/teichoic acid export membrane protein
MANRRRTKAGSSRAELSAPSGKLASSTQRVVTLTVVDQGASSISNFGLSVLVASRSDAREIGVFAIVVATYILCQGLVRSVTSDCLLTRSGVDSALRIRLERAGYLFALLSASGLSLVVLASSAVVGKSFAIPLVIFAISFPLMALQDFSRYIGISRHDPAYAIRLDVAWIGLFAVAVIGLRFAGLESLPWLFGAWTAAGALVGLSTVPTFLSLREAAQAARFWITSEWNIGVRFAGQFLVGAFGAYGVLYLLIFVMTIDAIGLIKVTQLAMAPVVVLFTGVQAALVSIISRKMREDRQQAIRYLHLGAVLMTLAMALWTVAVFLAPTKAVSDLFGSSWVQARPFMLWLGFATCLGMISQAYLIGLRAMRSARELLRLVIIMVPFLVGLPLLGAKVDGIRGVAVGQAAFYVINAVLAWVVLSRAAKRDVPEPSAEAGSLEGLGRRGDEESVTVADALALEGLVAPIPFADMFAYHQNAPEPISLSDGPASRERSLPMPFADLASRHHAAGTASRVRPSGGGNGSQPVPLADLVSRHQAAATSGRARPSDAGNGSAPVSFADLFARHTGAKPVSLADLMASRSDLEASNGTNGSPAPGE